MDITISFTAWANKEADTKLSHQRKVPKTKDLHTKKGLVLGTYSKPKHQPLPIFCILPLIS